MPPKKKEEEVDISQLPEWFAINCVLKYEGKLERANKLFKKLKEKPKTFQKNISRETIAAYAEEKGNFNNILLIFLKEIKSKQHQNLILKIITI